MLLILAEGTLTLLQNLSVIGWLVDVLGLLKGISFLSSLFIYLFESMEYIATMPLNFYSF